MYKAINKIPSSVATRYSSTRSSCASRTFNGESSMRHRTYSTNPWSGRNLDRGASHTLGSVTQYQLRCKSYYSTPKHFVRYYCDEVENAKKQKGNQHKQQGKKPKLADKLKEIHAGKDKAEENNIVAPTDDAEIVAPSERVKKIIALIKDCNFMEFNSLVIQLAKIQGISNPGKLMERAIETQMSFGSMSMAAGQMPASAAPAGGAATGGAAQGGAAPAADAAKEAEKPDAKGGKGGKKKKSKFKLTLVSYEKKHQFAVIKMVRKVKTGMNLMDSKALTEELPKVVNDAINQEDIEEFKEAFAKIPAVIEVQEV